MSVFEINLWYWIVDKLPKKLLYFCFMHIMAYSTTGKYSNTIVPDLTAMDAVDRFRKDKIDKKKNV